MQEETLTMYMIENICDIKLIIRIKFFVPYNRLHFEYKFNEWEIVVLTF